VVNFSRLYGGETTIAYKIGPQTSKIYNPSCPPDCREHDKDIVNKVECCRTNANKRTHAYFFPLSWVKNSPKELITSRANMYFGSS
jgi:hypothetical protein